MIFNPVFVARLYLSVRLNVSRDSGHSFGLEADTVANEDDDETEHKLEYDDDDSLGCGLFRTCFDACSRISHRLAFFDVLLQLTKVSNFSVSTKLQIGL